MTDPVYLGAEAIRALDLPPALLRQAMAETFRDYAAGAIAGSPKHSLDIGPGHGFQTMVAASARAGIAVLKWVAMAPVAPGSATPGINGLICVNDYTTGVPRAVMDGNEITLIRTAAMSAAAAAHLAPPAPQVIAMIGCGLQAHAHLAAFHDLFPGLRHLLAYSRSAASAEGLVDAARARGLQAEVCGDAADALARADIVISMVPGAPGLRPFLDARLLKRDAFVSAVDIGRSWLPESFPAFDLLATDSLQQSHAPYDINGQPVSTAHFDTDLGQLCLGDAAPAGRAGRNLFCFRGFAVADLALADLVLRRLGAAG